MYVGAKIGIMVNTVGNIVAAAEEEAAAEAIVAAETVVVVEKNIATIVKVINVVGMISAIMTATNNPYHKRYWEAYQGNSKLCFFAAKMNSGRKREKKIGTMKMCQMIIVFFKNNRETQERNLRRT